MKDIRLHITKDGQVYMHDKLIAEVGKRDSIDSWIKIIATGVDELIKYNKKSS